jgi:phage-related protein
MTLSTRPISWIKAVPKEFEKFPERAQSIFLNALTIAAEGGKSDIAKPMHAMGSGVFEIALPFRGDAYPRHLFSAARGGDLGHPRVSEKIAARHQDSKARGRSDPGSFE